MMKAENDLMLVIGTLLVSISELRRQCGGMKRMLATKLEKIGPAERSELLEDARELEILSDKGRYEASLFHPFVGATAAAG